MKQYPVKSLDLTGNLISDDGLKFLIKSIKDSGLEKLNLSKNKVGEKLIDNIISNLKICKCLKQINLKDNLIKSKFTKSKLQNGI